MLDRLAYSVRGMLSFAALVLVTGCQAPTEPPQASESSSPDVPVPTVVPRFSVSQRVDVTDVGRFDAGGTHVAQAVNIHGHVVGTSTDNSGNQRAFYWTPEDGMTDLGTTGGASAEAHDINDRNMVVGSSLDATGTEEIFIWSPEAGMQGLGTHSGTGAVGFGVNNAGQVVGTYVPSPTRISSFMWSSGGFSEIPGGDMTYANDINNNGQVVGVTRQSTAEPLSMFVWDAAGGYQAVAPMGAFYYEHVAFRINEFGTVAGGALNLGTGRIDPFVWHERTGYTDLRTQGFENAGSGLAVGINNLGHMTVLILNDDGTRTPAVWLKGTGTVELPSLGGRDGEIWAINDLGMVVGWSEDDTGNMRPAKWQLVFAAEERSKDVVDALQTIADTSSQSSQESLQEIIASARAAVAMFQQGAPDNVGALGELETAVRGLDDAIKHDGIAPDLGSSLREVLVQAARDVATAAVDSAIARGASKNRIFKAQGHLKAGRDYRAKGQHWVAVARFRRAVSIAEGIDYFRSTPPESVR